MRHFLEILKKPDNLPIILMVFGFGALLTWWWRVARRNDRLLAEGGEAAVAKAMAGPPPPPHRGPDAEMPAGEGDGKVHTWPHLLRIELLGAMVVLALLTVWSIVIDAPLEQMADPSRTPNPSKAPWYFLGLQEMLVYFDPWIAGVMLPLLIIFGLCAIPYLDPNPAASGYYSFRPRRFAISIFLFGFCGLWLPLIVVGTFFRGPGWGWFWVWEPWDAAAVADHATRDWPALFGIKSPVFSSVFGGLTLLAFFGIALALAFSPRARASSTYRRLGPVRTLVLVLLGMTMLGLPIKIALRLLFDVKYVFVSPWLKV